MSDQQAKYSGTRYTAPVAALVVAGVFTPALLLLSRPSGLTAPSVALGSSLLCVAFAWFTWKNYSELSIPTLAAALPRRLAGARRSAE